MANETKTLRFEFLADTKKFLGKVGAVGKKFDALGQDMGRVGGQINKVLVLLLVRVPPKQLVSSVLLRMECLRSLLLCLVSLKRQWRPWSVMF